MEFKTKIGNKNLEVQIGGLADQASGCCLIKYGETSILNTVQLGKERENLDFFPLTCDYEEKFYAAGKILGSRFFRREGRPSTEAILTSRMIDRAIRPLFPEKFFKEIQVIATCLSWDGENDPDVLGILGASISLLISEIPWNGPLAVCRVGKVGDNFILNPNYQEREKSDIDLLFSGVEGNGDILINMIEGQGDEVENDVLIKAFEFAKPFLKEVLDFQKKIAKEIGKEKIPFSPPEIEKTFIQEIKKFLQKPLEECLYGKGKQERERELKELKAQLFEKINMDGGESEKEAALSIFSEEKERILKENILKREKRPDGRKIDELREINVAAGILPRTHGSAMFTRGLTRVLAILTLGSPSDQQLLDGMEIRGKKRFLHHYNFPPYCSGEVKRRGSPGRREIGHGMLAEKALRPLIPDFDDFPYTIRVVSEVLSSNGSSSMASVSAACLALMDGGVPIKRPAAGIAVGLMGGGTEDYKLLTDIQGPEDSSGEMDFKVAGTEKGLTAIQMDVKIRGISGKIFREALERAKKARMEILNIQKNLLPAPKKELSDFAPRVYTLQINPEKIGKVIGSGGKIINEIIESCGALVDIEESGRVFVTADKESSAKKAVSQIEDIVREAKIGEVFRGKVKKIMDFGAFIEILPGQDGLCHISQFTPFKIRRVEDIIKIGDVIPVKVIGIDAQGKISLSAKEAGFKPKINKS